MFDGMASKKNRQLEHLQHQPSGRRYPVCFLAHDIGIPSNIGSLFRIADALGVERIHLSGSSPVPPNSKIRKTSRSTEMSVPFGFDQQPLNVIERLKSEGYTIISLEITSSSTDISDLVIAAGEKICLIVGSENQGVSHDLLDRSDKTVHIPMLGRNSSMNLATACAIATFEIIKRVDAV